MNRSLKIRLGLALLLGPAMGAAMGALGAPQLISILTGRANTEELKVPLAIIGAIAIPAILIVKVVREHRRNQGLQASAEILGLEVDSDVQHEDLPEKLRAFTPGGVAISVENVIQPIRESTRLRVGDMTYRSSSHGTRERSRQNYSQTFAFFEADRSLWPSFQLHPDNFVIRLFSRFSLARKRLVDIRPFHKKYRLYAEDQEAARRIFTEGVIDYFCRHPGLCVNAEANQLFVCRRHRLCPASELTDFINRATETTKL